MSAGYINHVVVSLDESGSMQPHIQTVPQVVDTLVKGLAEQSKALDIETRITVYTFNTEPRCVFYDMDVLRLPSLREHYHPDRQTALIDAVLLAIEDLELTPQKYGDHAFLLYVLTDGEENASVANQDRRGAQRLRERLERLPDNWTVGALVPNAGGRMYAQSAGFSPGNIQIWNTQRFEEAGAAITRSTTDWMEQRSRGVRGTRSLFSLDTQSLSQPQVEQLPRLHPGQYRLFEVKARCRIDEFIEHETGRAYLRGEGYYELVKPETVQASKFLALHDRQTHMVYAGRQARQILGLPDYEVRVSPTEHPRYRIFIQSTSNNRVLVAGERLLLLS